MTTKMEPVFETKSVEVKRKMTGDLSANTNSE